MKIVWLLLLVPFFAYAGLVLAKRLYIIATFSTLALWRLFANVLPIFLMIALITIPYAFGIEMFGLKFSAILLAGVLLFSAQKQTTTELDLKKPKLNSLCFIFGYFLNRTILTSIALAGYLLFSIHNIFIPICLSFSLVFVSASVNGMDLNNPFLIATSIAVFVIYCLLRLEFLKKTKN